MTPSGGYNGQPSAIRTNESRAWHTRLIFFTTRTTPFLIAHNAAGRETYLSCHTSRARPALCALDGNFDVRRQDRL